jgi:hypothetical protein
LAKDRKTEQGKVGRSRERERERERRETSHTFFALARGPEGYAREDEARLDLDS